jgi:hypothetical protein
MLPATFAGLTTAGKVTDDTAVASVSVKFYRTVAGVKYFWDGTSFSTTAAVAPISLSTSDVHQFNWSLTTQPSASQAIAGSYSIQVTGRDTSGNSATATCNFVLRDEITPPSLSIATPGVNQSLRATALTTVGIKGNVTDASGVASVNVKLYRTLPGGVKEYWNGASFGSASVSVPGDISNLPSWSLATMPTAGQLTPGAYGLSVTAVDTLGNTSSPATRNFTISGSSSALKFNSSGNCF